MAVSMVQDVSQPRPIACEEQPQFDEEAVVALEKSGRLLFDSIEKSLQASSKSVPSLTDGKRFFRKIRHSIKKLLPSTQNGAISINQDVIPNVSLLIAKFLQMVEGALPEVRNSLMQELRECITDPCITAGRVYLNATLRKKDFQVLLEDLLSRLHFSKEGAVPFLQKICDELIDFLAADKRLASLGLEENKEKFSQIVELNICTILTQICNPEKGLPETIHEAINRLPKDFMSDGIRKDPVVDILAPILLMIFQECLAQGFAGLDRLFTEDVGKKLTRILIDIIGAHANATFKKYDENLDTHIATFVGHPASPKMRVFRGSLLRQMRELRRDQQYPRKESEALALGIIRVVRVLVPELQIPEFILKNLVMRAIPYLEIPLPSIANSVLKAASEADISLKDLLGGDPSIGEVKGVDVIRTPHELLRRWIGEKIETAKQELAASTSSVSSLQLHIQIFLLSIAAAIVPYIIFGRERELSQSMADRAHTLAHIVRIIVPDQTNTPISPEEESKNCTTSS